MAAKTFSVIIFLCDGLLQVSKHQEDHSLKNGSRFLKVASQLPMELQMVLVNRTWRVSRDFVQLTDSEAGFRDLAKTLEQS